MFLLHHGCWNSIILCCPSAIRLIFTFLGAYRIKYWSHIFYLFLCSETFTEDDWKLVQLVLTLFRNLLAVQGVSIQQKLGGSTSQFLSVRDRFLELLFKENVTDLILALTQHVGGPSEYFRQDNLLLLETIHYLFMGQVSELVAKANRKDSQVGSCHIEGG